MTHEVGHQKNGCGKKKKNVRKLVGSAMAKVTEFTAEHQRRHPEQRAENARRKQRSRSNSTQGDAAPPPIGSAATLGFWISLHVGDVVGEIVKTSGVETGEGLPRSDH